MPREEIKGTPEPFGLLNRVPIIECGEPLVDIRDACPNVLLRPGTLPYLRRTAAQMLWLVGSNPMRRQAEAPTLADTDRVLDAYVANYLRTGDANDILYAIEASRDYDPGPALEKIRGG